MNSPFRLLIFCAVLISLLGASLITVSAGSDLIGTHTTVYLTARVQNKWWYAGNLHCKSASMETMGQTYNGAIEHANWWGMAGNESCFITFSNVLYPLAFTPATLTVSYFALAGEELVNAVTNDRLQVQQEDYFLEFAWYDDYVILNDMVLQDTSTVPVIQVDPADLPELPEVPGIPAP